MIVSLGLRLIAEDTTSKGRVDLTIVLPGKVYINEFKVDQPQSPGADQEKGVSQ